MGHESKTLYWTPSKSIKGTGGKKIHDVDGFDCISGMRKIVNLDIYLFLL